ERLAVGRLLGLLVGAGPAREHDGLALEVIGALPPCIERQRAERQRGRGSAGQDGAACGLGHLSPQDLRFSRNVRPVYFVRNRPRRCSSGTTLRQNCSNIPGWLTGDTTKPSHAPDSNTSCRRSATIPAVPTISRPRPRVSATWAKVNFSAFMCCVSTSSEPLMPWLPCRLASVTPSLTLVMSAPRLLEVAARLSSGSIRLSR